MERCDGFRISNSVKSHQWDILAHFSQNSQARRLEGRSPFSLFFYSYVDIENDDLAIFKCRTTHKHKIKFWERSNTVHNFGSS